MLISQCLNIVNFQFHEGVTGGKRIRKRSSHPKMLELIKPTSITSVFLQMVNKQKSIFSSDVSSRTLAKNSMWKDWQRYLDNIRSMHAKFGPIFVGRLKEKSLKKVHLIHISWPELHIKQQMPHMFSRPVFIKLQSNTANIVGKDQRS